MTNPPHRGIDLGMALVRPDSRDGITIVISSFAFAPLIHSGESGKPV